MDPLSDDITLLPTDKANPSRSELVFMDTFLKQKSSSIAKLSEHGKEAIIIVGLFCLLSLPIVDIIIVKYLPSMSSDTLRIIMKGCLLAFLLFTIKYIHLVRQ